MGPAPVAPMIAAPVVSPVTVMSPLASPSIGAVMVLAGQIVQMVSESAVAGQMAASASGMMVAAMAGQKGIAAGVVAAIDAMMTQKCLRIVPAKSVMLPHPRERPLMGAPGTVPCREGIAVVVTGSAGVCPGSPLTAVASVKPATGMIPQGVRAGRIGMAAVVLITTEVLPAIHSAAGMTVELPTANISTAEMIATIMARAATVETAATTMMATAVMATPAAKIASAKVPATIMAAAAKTVTSTEATPMPTTKAPAVPTAKAPAVSAAKATPMSATKATPVATPPAMAAATPMAQRGCWIGQAEQDRGDERRTHGQNASTHRISPHLRGLRAAHRRTFCKLYRFDRTGCSGFRDFHQFRRTWPAGDVSLRIAQLACRRSRKGDRNERGAEIMRSKRAFARRQTSRRDFGNCRRRPVRKLTGMPDLTAVPWTAVESFRLPAPSKFVQD